MRFALLLATVAAAVVAVSGGMAATDSTMKPAIETKSNIGKVIATPMKLGIYYWDVEKKAGGKIKCTGSCLKQWPPVYVTGTVPEARHGSHGHLRHDQAWHEAPAHGQRPPRLHVRRGQGSNRQVRRRRRLARGQAEVAHPPRPFGGGPEAVTPGRPVGPARKSAPSARA